MLSTIQSSMCIVSVWTIEHLLDHASDRVAICDGTFLSSWAILKIVYKVLFKNIVHFFVCFTALDAESSSCTTIHKR